MLELAVPLDCSTPAGDGAGSLDEAPWVAAAKLAAARARKLAVTRPSGKDVRGRA